MNINIGYGSNPLGKEYMESNFRIISRLTITYKKNAKDHPKSDHLIPKKQ
jgi:hypothetical protein